MPGPEHGSGRWLPALSGQRPLRDRGRPAADAERRRRRGGPATQQVCVAARCVPSTAIPNPDQVALAAGLPGSERPKCVPDPFIATLGQFLAKECRSLIDAEGRCIPVLLPAVRSQVDRLPQADCAADERCAPCYDPLTGVATGACTAGCGPGPDEPAEDLRHLL